jgi:cytochrome d ubiquinol oxidase subunit II
MIEYVAALVPILSLFIYAVLFSIECGATLFIIAPALVGGDDSLIHRYINPAWETTNVFLIFALIWLIAFFPGAAPIWGHALILPLFLFLAVMGIRATGMLYVFYKGGSNRAMKYLLLAASFAAPMTLAGGVLPYFLSGAMPYGAPQLFLAGYFSVMAFVSTLFLSTAFFRSLAIKQKLHTMEHLDVLAECTTAIFVSAVCISVPLLANLAPRIAIGMQIWLPLVILLAMLNLILKKRFRFILAVALFGSVFFSIMISQLPYIIYPTATIFSSFTDPASANIMLIAFGIAALVLIPSLGLLYYVITSKKD